MRGSFPPSAIDALLAAIVESSDDAIVSKDLNGIVTSWNPAAERLFGFTADEMIGQSITRIIPVERLSEEDHVLGCIRAGVRVDHFETVRRSKTGQLLDVSLTVSPVRDPSGTIVGASKIARDITEHKRLLAAQRQAIAAAEAAKRDALEAENRRIQHASHLQALFVANMSHELRTPLNSIVGFAELIADERFGRLPKRYREFASVMLASGEHLLRLINDILDLAKIEAGKIDLRPARVAVGPIIEEVCAAVNGLAADRRIEIRTCVPADLADVFLDPARLKQVLYNYISNALKFTPEGGRISIRAGLDAGDALRIEVEDSGIGITPDDQSRLFVQFEQLDTGAGKHYPGTGLGLALTKQIVEAQGGTVGVVSEVGKGSTFFATLPRVVVTTSAEVGSSR